MRVRRSRPRSRPPSAPAAARVGIVARVAAAGGCCVCDLNAAFELSQPTISHHLKVLRDAGLVESSRRGTWAYYRLVPRGPAAPRPGLRAVRAPSAPAALRAPLGS